MKRTIEHPINRFFIGEIYLYTKFGNLLQGETIEECEQRLDQFKQSGAINFQKDPLSKYIDWEEKKEYVGFLTIFFKQDNKYICLHDGKTYQKQDNIIDNIIPLTDILPKINKKYKSRISIYQALELFDMLFKEEFISPIMYQEQPKPITDFYVGDIILREQTTEIEDDTRIKYIDLPNHLILQKAGLLQRNYEEQNNLNSVYRCLFLRDLVDLYNIHNSQFYNPYEDNFETLIPFTEYLYNMEIPCDLKSITIPKALRLFKKSI